MSLFEYKSVCENVKFYSHHIAPSDGTADGILTLSNGPKTTANAPDQTFRFKVVNNATAANPSSNHMILDTNNTTVFDVSPNGAVNFPVALFVKGVPVGGSGLESSNVAALTARITELEAKVAKMSEFLALLNEAVFIEGWRGSF